MKQVNRVLVIVHPLYNPVIDHEFRENQPKQYFSFKSDKVPARPSLNRITLNASDDATVGGLDTLSYWYRHQMKAAKKDGQTLVVVVRGWEKGFLQKQHMINRGYPEETIKKAIGRKLPKHTPEYGYFGPGQRQNNLVRYGQRLLKQKFGSVRLSYDELQLLGDRLNDLLIARGVNPARVDVAISGQYKFVSGQYDLQCVDRSIRSLRKSGFSPRLLKGKTLV